MCVFMGGCYEAEGGEGGVGVEVECGGGGGGGGAGAGAGMKMDERVTKAQSSGTSSIWKGVCGVDPFPEIHVLKQSLFFLE